MTSLVLFPRLRGSRFAWASLAVTSLALTGCGGGGNGFGSPSTSSTPFNPFSALKYSANGQFGNTGAGTLSGPYGLARDSQGNVYVTEISSTASGRVLKFDKTGTFVTQFGTTGTGQLTEPEMVAVDAQGDVYVADYANGQAGAVSRVVKFDPTGAYLAQFGATGTATTGLLSFPVGIAVDAQGNVYVTDGTAGSASPARVVEFDKMGAFITQFGATGAGLLNAPEGLTLDAQGDVYVADYANGQAGAVSRVVKFDPTGAYLAQFGATGTGALGSPQGVTVDPLGNVYVSDEANTRVVKFGPTGTYLTQFDTTEPGSATASDPLGLVVDGSGNVFVADGNLNSVVVFQPQQGAAPAARPRVAGSHVLGVRHHGHA